MTAIGSPRPIRFPRQLDLFEREAERHLAGRVVPGQLLDRPVNQLRPLPQQLRLPGVLQQREHSVADEVDRRLVAGEEEHDAGRHQLPVVQLLAGVRDLDETRHQALVGVLPPPREHFAEVGGELFGGAGGLGENPGA